MVAHELRDDYNGAMRAKRSERRDPPLLWSPYISRKLPASLDGLTGIDRIRVEIRVAEERPNFTLMDAYDIHAEGALRRADSRKLFQHAFLQFPTDIEITPESEREMLAQGVAFINRTYGGNAVFHARLDRDEKGRHGVDVFFAPRYAKTTAKGTEDWISLSKFSKELARARFGQRQKTVRNRKTGEFDLVTDKAGKPVMLWNDSGHFQGRALQDAFFEHLRDSMGLTWAVRGERKKNRNDDWKTPEEIGAEKDLLKAQERVAEAERKAVEAQTRLEAAKARLEPLRAALEALEAHEAAEAARRDEEIRIAAATAAIPAFFKGVEDHGAEPMALAVLMGSAAPELRARITAEMKHGLRDTGFVFDTADDDPFGMARMFAAYDDEAHLHWSTELGRSASVLSSDVGKGIERLRSRFENRQTEDAFTVQGTGYQRGRMQLVMNLIRKTLEMIGRRLGLARFKPAPPPQEATAFLGLPEPAQEKVRSALATDQPKSSEP